ncbi:MAG: hypothetical protein CMH46_12370 [Muricauda sp.]|nr:MULTISPECIES: hypothetical protein [unclassified Allomuricauda]MAU16319.1 hypothetical protein [Allomuricauda sp.]|tara:strand:+ start:2663 stop:3331 length:669 start_codon:yes stop_codon:yes gene_type:complete
MKNILRGITFFILLAGCFGFLLLGNCSSDRKFVNIALKENHKIYLVPFFASRATLRHQLSKNEIPAVYHMRIIEDNRELFVEPKDFEKILNLIGDNYVLFKKRESTHDGYVGFKDLDIYDYSIKNVNTDKIGQQIHKATIVITNASTNKSMEIVWKISPVPKAEKNCTNKKIWVVENPHPGETIGYYQKAVVINLNEIVDFFDNGTRLEYDKSEEILYVIKQ